MNLIIAKTIRDVQNIYRACGYNQQIEHLLNELASIIKQDQMYGYLFNSLPLKLKNVLASQSVWTVNPDAFLERAAQLFEANELTPDIIHLHLNDPIEVFVKLDQVREILKHRAQGFLLRNNDSVKEKSFWAEYDNLGCDANFTFDNYNKLIKLFNKFGLPDNLLRSCHDVDGNQLSYGDNVISIRDIVNVQSGKKIPKDTQMAVQQFNAYKNYIEVNHAGVAWVIHAIQVLKI